ncbi:GHMP kinase [Halomarina halobia]|uniref:Pantoate kinase n=1 Tax=Halomarina halobia TaxID=3033386 RepID=A0ABD6AA97_9EURY|nr:GHMP kinase [Halomarina sp. PSR21]
MHRQARAYAPGSVTTVFAPGDEPGGGSLGVSVAVEDGVVATVEPADETVIRLDGEATSFEPVERALDRLGVRAVVSLDAGVPVGCGFGASGAATLATALAANEAFVLGEPRGTLVGVAHRAEVAAGTGLGDVFVQSRGGLVWNVGGGIRRARCDARVEYAALGGIATEAVLGDERALARVREAGRATLDRIDPTGAFDALLDRSWAFARRTGLATDPVVEAVARVQRAGGVGTMAMVGETVIATGVEGVLDRETRVTNEGAHVR